MRYLVLVIALGGCSPGVFSNGVPNTESQQVAAPLLPLCLIFCRVAVEAINSEGIRDNQAPISGISGGTLNSNQDISGDAGVAGAADDSGASVIQ